MLCMNLPCLILLAKSACKILPNTTQLLFYNTVNNFEINGLRVTSRVRKESAFYAEQDANIDVLADFVWV